MNTTISIPDALFIAADQYAQDNGLSRSELYARAIHYFLEANRYEGITEMLNCIYAEEDSTLDEGLCSVQSHVLSKEGLDYE